MTLIALDRIVEGERARREYRNLDQLADSIRQLGVLSPVTLTPDLHLVCGGRRVRAARMAGLERIPAVIATNMDDALNRLRAERDENTCREPMTPEELVDLGSAIEAMERPKAAERQGRVGLPKGAPAPSGPMGPDGAKDHPTRVAVADALGVSRTSYARMKHVVDISRGDIPATPEVQEVAKEALTAMNNGTISSRRGYEDVKKAREAADSKVPAATAPRLAIPQPQIHGPRPKHKQLISNAVNAGKGMQIILDGITGLDESLTSEEAGRLASDLSEFVRSLKRIQTMLTRKATS